MSGDLALKFLSEEREALNARAARARVSAGGFDSGEFSSAFARIVSGLLPALERAAEYAAARELLLAIFDACADFSEKGAFRGLLDGGGEAEALVDGISDLLVRRLDVLRAEPRFGPGTLMNAYLKLRREDPTRAERWKDAVSGLAELRGADSFMRCGILAAWLAGFRSYKDAALAGLAEMDRALAEEILGLAGGALDGRDMAAFSRELGRRPWAMPAELLRGASGERLVVEIVGAFMGLGGAFIAPPIVSKTGDQFIVTDGRRVFALLPDRFGSWLERRDGEPPLSPGEVRERKSADARPPWGIDARGGSLKIKSRGLLLDLEGGFPLAVSSVASDDDTLCVTSPHSHAILVAGRALA